MSSTKECQTLLNRYSIARIPFIVIDAIERERALEILKNATKDSQMNYYVHTLSKGVYDLHTGKEIKDEKTIYGAIDFISEQMRRKQYVNMVFTEVPDISADSDDSRTFYDLVSLANESAGSIIVLSNNAVWNRLQRLGMIVHVDVPDEDEMLSIVEEYIEDYRNQIQIEWDQEDMKEVAAILNGITKIEAENIIASLIAKKEITKQDIEELSYSKDRLFSDISGLEKIRVDKDSVEIAGLSGLQNWLNEKKELLQPEKREAMRKLGLQSPRGILLVGVPGCGKSLSAKAIACNWHLPLYRLDFATVQGSYVGQSEQQLKEALSTAENVSPCILWIDEIEKGLSGATSSNDGGVSQRMVGQFLFWLQECRKQVFVVATANDVSRLPSELLRRGRFDELFFIDLPTVEERKEILSLFTHKYLHMNIDEDLWKQLSSITEGFTGADLESSVRDIAYRIIANPELTLNNELIIETFNNVVPLSQTSPEKIEDIRNWGKTRAVPASGKPIGAEKISEITQQRSRKILM